MSDEPNDLKRVPSQIKGLDEVLHGGFIKGGLYIVEGAPGTGKTILGNQLCFNLARNGNRVLYVTLIAETVGRMLLNIRNMSFFDETGVGAAILYISAFNALKNEGLTGLLHLLRREVTSRRASVLVVDGFASAADSAKSPEELKIFIQQLQTQADAVDCTVFLLTNPREHKPSSEETMVEGIITMASCVYDSRFSRELCVRKFRGSGFLQGVHSYEISGNGITVYPRIESLTRLIAGDDGATIRISSGISRLDQMIGGGIPSRSITMLIGPSGIGKTITGMNFLGQSSSEEPGLLFGFYETPARVMTKAASICPPMAAAIEAGHIELVWQPPTDNLLDSLADRLLQAVRRRCVRRVLIDGFGGFKKAINARPIEIFFSALARELRSEHVTTLCTTEVPEILGPTLSTPVSGLSDLIDNLVLMRYVEADARLHRVISVLKIRDSDFDSDLRLFSIGPNGIEISENSESARSILASTAGSRRHTTVNQQ